MQVYLYIEINLIALIILVLIYRNMRRKFDKQLTEHKIFLYIMLLTSFILIFDTIMWGFDGRNTSLIRWILNLSSACYFILHPIICIAWSVYVDFQINHNLNRIKRMLLPMSITVIINAIFSILSIYGNLYFFYDNNNVYHRGTYFFLVPLLSFAFVVYTTFYVLIYRKRIPRPFFFSYLMFSVPPVLGAVIQISIYGLSLIWIGMTLSILIIFINIQNEQMYMDYLTGLFNRRQLDFYLQELMHKRNANIAGIMLDINSFKNINDQYGHCAGDEALKSTSQILKQTFDNKAFISRYGGDEFVILLEVKDRSDLDKAIHELKLNVQQFNKSKQLPYKIDFSIGADLYPDDINLGLQNFLAYIDTLMYKDKHTLLQRS